MREAWSINALSDSLGPDRRTISRWLNRAEVKPSKNGPNGPLFRLRDAVAVLAEAGLFSSDPVDAFDDEGVRELVNRLRRALVERGVEVRMVREVLVAELYRYLEPRESVPPDWASMSDRELAAALDSLVDEGFLA